MSPATAKKPRTKAQQPVVEPSIPVVTGELVPTPAKIGRPRKFNSPEELQAGIDAYFTGQDEKAARAEQAPIYSMHGLAVALDTSRSTLLRYEDAPNQWSDDPNVAEAFQCAVKRARERVAAWTEERLYHKGQHPASPIFSLKNNFGWKDEQQVSVNVGVALGIQVGDDAHRTQLAPINEAIARARATLSPQVNAVMHSVSDDK